MTEKDKQALIDTVNEQSDYIDRLQAYLWEIGVTNNDICYDILDCNKLMMEILVPPQHKLVKLFDRNENET